MPSLAHDGNMILLPVFGALGNPYMDFFGRLIKIKFSPGVEQLLGVCQCLGIAPKLFSSIVFPFFGFFSL